MEIEFNGKIIFWKGPAPFLFVPIPAKHSRNAWREVMATLL
jgi:hypothetical protein